MGDQLAKITPQPQQPQYGGSKEAMEQVKVEQDEAEALKETQKVLTQIRTPAEQYRQELAMLNTLLEKGYLTQEQYNKAVEQAKDKMNGTRQQWEQLGQSIGKTLNQAILFQTSWVNALKAILVQIAELIIKMELMKALTDSGNGGGFFGSLIKGLAGAKAGGGGVSGGSSYLVGENGPEVFTPGASGFVTPGVFGGGGDTHYHIDARGATDPAATEMAIRRAISEEGQRSALRAVTMINEQNKRRR